MLGTRGDECKWGPIKATILISINHRFPSNYKKKKIGYIEEIELNKTHNFCFGGRLGFLNFLSGNIVAVCQQIILDAHTVHTDPYIRVYVALDNS